MNSPDQAHALKTQLVIVTEIVLLGLIVGSQVFNYVAGIVGLVFLILPSVGRLIARMWFQLAQVLGWINSRILLTIVYFLILCPLIGSQRLASNPNPLQIAVFGGSVATGQNNLWIAD